MLLVKCSCKCHSTLDDNYFNVPQNRIYKCPNCNKSLNISRWHEIGAIEAVLKENGFELHSIPDNTTIYFKFNIS